MARIRLCVVGAVALAGVSCQDHGPPTAVSPPLSAEFRDAMHGGGNPHFYLLPPFVSQPDLTKETFESGLQPSVRVTELAGAPGTAFAGCTDEQITYIPASEFTRFKTYAAFWRPANFSHVTPPCVYRLQVEVFGAASTSGTVLGFADVQVLSKTTLKYLKTGQYIPLPKDLTLPFWFFIGQGAVFYGQTGTDACRVDRDCVEAIVSPTKETTVITKNKAAGILIPAGSFKDQITLVIEEQTERPCIDPSNLGLPEFNANRTGCYRYRRFPESVGVSDAEGAFLTVGMCVDIGGLTHPGRADLLQIFRFDPGPREGAGEAEALENASAAFLPCEQTRFLLGQSGVGAFLNGLRRFLAPQPLHAAMAGSFIHTGVGGVCSLKKCLSAPIFTWGIPGTVIRNSADPQVAPSGTPVAAPPSVLVTDLGESPLANATVRFEVIGGAGSIAALGGTAGTTVVLTTDANGIATLGSWTLGLAPGANQVQAVVPGAVDTVTFTATGLTSLTINFDLTPTGAAVTPGTVVNSVYATQGITFTKLGPGTTCGSGPEVYANGDNPGGVGNTVSTCQQGIASDISANSFGVIEADFAIAVSSACIDVRPPVPLQGPNTGFAFLESFDTQGVSLGRTTSSPGVNQTLCISGTGIRSVRFSGDGDNFARFDNLVISF